MCYINMKILQECSSVLRRSIYRAYPRRLCLRYKCLSEFFLKFSKASRWVDSRPTWQTIKSRRCHSKEGRNNRDGNSSGRKSLLSAVDWQMGLEGWGNGWGGIHRICDDNWGRKFTLLTGGNQTVAFDDDSVCARDMSCTTDLVLRGRQE